MKSLKSYLCVLLAVALMVTLVTGCGNQDKAERPEDAGARALLKEADRLYGEQMFTEAAKTYLEAMELFEQDTEDGEAGEKALECRNAIERITYFLVTYELTEEEIRQGIAETYPQVSEAEANKWLEGDELEKMEVDGETRYFTSAVDNLAYRYTELMHANQAKNETYAELVKNILGAFPEAAYSEWQPYGDPVAYRTTGNIDIPREELPDEGLFQIWIPLPILTGPQNPVSLVSVTPDTYAKQPPSQDEDIGLLYLEVPLEELDSNLAVEYVFEFTHFTQLFEIDPDNVGSYNEDSAEYLQYTKSYGNTLITDEIREAAASVVGDEKNPYFQARMLYDYILEEIKYSLMPHFTMWPRGVPESEYVHQMKRGDCGAQSMYFSALCRSLGIPARTTGGWQLFTGELSGHFWAEFLLPNYGWIPVDPTAAEIADLTNLITPEEDRRFKDFFFGGQDPMRCVVQLDVDLPLVPPADGEIFLPLAVQNPVANCSTFIEIPPSVVVLENHTYSTEVVSGRPVAGEHI